MLPEPYPPSVATGSTSVLRERRNYTHPSVIPPINTRQDRDERLHIGRIGQRSSSKIPLNRVVGILRRTLLGAMQSDPGHLRQVVHREKFQSCVRIVFFILNPTSVGGARLRVGVLLMSKRAVKPTVTLAGIPVEIASIPWGGITTPSRSGFGCGEGR